jgi:thiol-disulfide isomerase/thioredoxin
VTRARGAVLVAVLVLLAGALVLGTRGSGGSPAAQQPKADVAALRAAARLDPCPAGLSPALPKLDLACVGAAGTVPIAARGPGRPTLVNVWGTWCPPCVDEAPLLEQLHARTDAVGVVGVLTQDTVENALHFSTDASLGFHMSYPSVDDPQGVVMRRYGPGPPITLFVTAAGRIAYVHVGKLTSAAQLDALVRQHLGVAL